MIFLFNWVIFRWTSRQFSGVFNPVLTRRTRKSGRSNRLLQGCDSSEWCHAFRFSLRSLRGWVACGTKKSWVRWRLGKAMPQNGWEKNPAPFFFWKTSGIFRDVMGKLVVRLLRKILHFSFVSLSFVSILQGFWFPNPNIISKGPKTSKASKLRDAFQSWLQPQLTYCWWFRNPARNVENPVNSGTKTIYKLLSTGWLVGFLPTVGWLENGPFPGTWNIHF